MVLQGAVAMGLGIDGNGDSLAVIGLRIDKDVADTVKVFDNRHSRLGTDPFDQSLAAPGAR